MTPTELALFFHDTYERLAPSFGYTTRADTKLFDPDTPNGRLMTAVAERVLAEQERRATARAQQKNWPVQSFAAPDWAKEFVKRNPSVSYDLALAWFAAALMRGYDERQYELNRLRRETDALGG